MPRKASTSDVPSSAEAQGRYRKIEVRTWGDEKFRALTPIPPCGQGLWLFLIGGPHGGSLPGLFRAGRAAMAEELGWSVEAFMEAFREVFAQGMVEADFDARLVWLPNAVKHNKPSSPNVVKHWAREFESLPECDLKRRAFEALKASIHAAGEAFGKAFDESFRKPSGKAYLKASGNQEQEQEQEQEQKKNPPKPPGGGRARKAILAAEQLERFERWYQPYPCKKNRPAAERAWAKLNPNDELVARMIRAVDVQAQAEGWRTPARAQYCPHPGSWLNGERWNDEPPVVAAAPRTASNGFAGQPIDILANPKPQWALDAGFANRFEAENELCFEHNAHLFRDGRKVA